jgi:hypothetical protein
MLTSSRYDLNAMFKKKFGFMTVNVQGLSRVRLVYREARRRANATAQGMFILKALYWGKAGAKKNYAHQIRTLVGEARSKLGEVPIVFGECGIPMDLKCVGDSPARVTSSRVEEGSR